MENKTSKYFKYAIGEIILVVIGILIALQINNWNDKNNRTLKKRGYLKALRTELETNILSIKSYINLTHQDIVEVANTIEKLNLKEIQSYNDSVLSAYMNTRPIFKSIVKKSTYDDLINSGILEELENTELKGGILSIPAHIERIDEKYNQARAAWNDFQLPYLIKYSNVSRNWDTIRGVKITRPKFKKTKQAFVNNKEYANILALRLRMMGNYEDTLENTLKSFIEISGEIKKHLNNDD